MSFDLSKPLEEWTAEELEALAARKREEEKARQIEETKAAIETVQESLQLLEEKRKLHVAELTKLRSQLAELEGKEPETSRRWRTPKKMVGAHIRLRQIMKSGLAAVPLPIRATLHGQTHEALVIENGQILCDGQEFGTPSGAAMHLLPGKTANGWVVWRYQDDNGEWCPLYHLREAVYRHQSAKDEEQ
jgi:hypothetical protein